MVYVFPAHRFNPDPVSADVEVTTISGGTAINGEEDVIATDGGGRWKITYSDIGLDDPELVRLWEAWRGELAGGATSVLVPILSLSTAPRPSDGQELLDPSDIYADDPEFPTEVRFRQPYIVAEVAADAALRATTLEIEVTQGSRAQAGQKFSIGTRAYKIVRVTARDGQSATCKILPPLREAVTTGAAIDFNWPVVECRLAVGQDNPLSVMLGTFADTSISFVEHVTYE